MHMELKWSLKIHRYSSKTGDLSGETMELVAAAFQTLINKAFTEVRRLLTNIAQLDMFAHVALIYICTESKFMHSSIILFG